MIPFLAGEGPCFGGPPIRGDNPAWFHAIKLRVCCFIPSAIGVLGTTNPSSRITDKS